MNAFEYAKPTSIKDAVELLGAQWGDTEVLAGGTDLLSLMKDYIVTPKRVVDIKGIREIAGVQASGGGLRIGAIATLQDLVENREVVGKFRVLQQAAAGVPGPQVRNRGTVAGDLVQRPRCWWFRLGYGVLAMRDGQSLVPGGDNRYHAILGNDGPAYFVSSSSLAPALVALDAELTVVSKAGNRKVKASDFFMTPKTNSDRETVLKPNEMITEIRVPANPATSATYEVRQKTHIDYPIATASVVLTMAGDSVKSARIVMGQVAPRPWRASEAEAALSGKKITEETAMAAAEAAVKGAKALSRNGYKIQLARTAVKRAILAAAKV